MRKISDIIEKVALFLGQDNLDMDKVMLLDHLPKYSEEEEENTESEEENKKLDED